MLPVDVLVNVTASGEAPEVTLALKLATGATVKLGGTGAVYAKTFVQNGGTITLNGLNFYHT